MLLFIPVGQDLEKRIVWLRNSAFFRTAIDVLLNVGDIRLCVCVCVRVCVCMCVFNVSKWIHNALLRLSFVQAIAC